MATSSIFHNVILRTPEQVEAFINAAEASLADPYERPEGMTVTKVINEFGNVKMVYTFPDKNAEAKA